MNQAFLETAEKQFLYYKQLGEKAMEQLETQQLFQAWHEDTNSIAVIVKHLWGNMLSRWTDVLTSDGENLGARGMRNSSMTSPHEKNCWASGRKAGTAC